MYVHSVTDINPLKTSMTIDTSEAIIDKNQGLTIQITTTGFNINVESIITFYFSQSRS